LEESRGYQRLLAELKRRRVFRVAAAYGAVAFVVLQAAELLAGGLQLPPAVLSSITVVVILGFPISLALAWAFERAPDGALRRTDEAESGEIEAIVSESRLRRWAPGIAALAGVALLAIGAWLALARLGGAGSGAGGDQPATMAGSGGEVGVPEEGTVTVIAPFAVQGGPEVAYLSEGMVSLLGTKLDGAGDLRTVDTRAVMHAMARTGLEPGDPAAGAAIAREFGAGLFVVGDIVEAGGRVQLSAALYEAGGAGAPKQEASAEGAEADMFELVDELAVQLLAGVTGGAAARVRRIAAVTTESLPALKSFLEGEEQFRRGQFDASLASFQRAIDADSTFALAHYRLSLVAEWALQDALSHDAAEDAVRWADRLATRDRRMLEAYLTRRRGDNRTAAEAYRSILGTWPDEMEAWLDYGEILFHVNPLFGRSFTESREVLDRVLAFDPDHSTALIHLARMAAFEGQGARLDSLADRFVALDPDPGRTLEISALQAYASGDSGKIEAVEARIREAPNLGVALAVWAASVYGGDIEAGESVARALAAPTRSVEARRLGRAWLAYFAVTRGQWTEAERRLAELAELGAGVALEYEALLATSPFVPVTDAELADLARRLEALDPATVETSDNPNVVFTSHDDLHPLIRHYQLGLIRARLGDADAARRHARELEAIELPATAGSLAPDLAHSVRAAALRSEGRAAEALAELERARTDAWYGQTMSSPLYARVAERFARAELLLELGRLDEAKGWYSSIGELSPFELPYRSVSQLRLAQIADRRGDAAAAAEHRAAFEAAWREADPAMREAAGA
jgi:tetratricopeptide (TPR) repeat protein